MAAAAVQQSHHIYEDSTRLGLRQARETKTSHYRRSRNSPPNYTERRVTDDDARRSADAVVHEAMLAQQQQPPAVVSTGPYSTSPDRKYRSSSNNTPTTTTAANTGASFQTRPLPPSPPRTSHPPSYSTGHDSTMYDAAPDGRSGTSGAYPTRRAARRDARAARRASGADGSVDLDNPHTSNHSVSMSRGAAPITSYDEAISDSRMQSQQQPIQMQQQRPISSAHRAVDMSASSIDRLGSPSVTKMVLEPLETKMREYQVLIDESQREITDLDERLRILQEERRKAEERYIEVKAKHEEYEKRHLHVNKALKGEFQQMQQQLQQSQQAAAAQRELQYQQQQQQPPPLEQAPTWTMQRQSVDSFDSRTSRRSDGTNRTKTKSKFLLGLFNKS